jgi:hypothetical protein
MWLPKSRLQGSVSYLARTLPVGSVEASIVGRRASYFKRDGYFFQVHEEWFESPAFRDLSCPARCLLFEMLNIYRPSRNGQISLSVENAAIRLGKTRKTVQRHFHELAEHGFIVLTSPQFWMGGRAREWRLTIMPVGSSSPTDEWKDWPVRGPFTQLAKISELPAGKYYPGKG